MDRILIILKKENGPRASSAPALGLNTTVFEYVYWYVKQISGERLQDHWSSCIFNKAVHSLFDVLFVKAVFGYDQENKPMKQIPPYTPLLYSKTGVCRGIPIFLIFATNHRLWILVRTASPRRF